MALLVYSAGADMLIIPFGTVEIEDEAFRGCVNLKEVQLPQSLMEIGEDAFADCGECLLIACPPGSEAVAWAAAARLDWDADTVCRGLSVGQTYTGTDQALIGPTYDMHAMAFCLRKMCRTNYTVTERTNLTAEGIRNAAASAFAEAGENDISLFYFSGHGDSDGSLVGSDMSTLTPSELRACLDGISGRKVVIIDACYSGNLIQDGNEASAAGSSVMSVNSLSQSAVSGEASDNEGNGNMVSFTDSFLDAFSGGGSGKYLRSRGALQSENYFGPHWGQTPLRSHPQMRTILMISL